MNSSEVSQALSDSAYVFNINLPGIGQNTTAIPVTDPNEAETKKKNQLIIGGIILAMIIVAIMYYSFKKK